MLKNRFTKTSLVKMIVISLFVLCIMNMAFAQETPLPDNPPGLMANDITWGDVNGDSEVDIIDALLVAQYYVGLIQTFTTPRGADVNADTLIDIVDALLIAQYYVGLIDKFPADTPSSTPVPLPPGILYKDSLEVTVDSDGNATAAVSLMGADGCTELADWGSVSRSGNYFSVTIVSYQNPGFCDGALVPFNNSYSLGFVEAGDYTFSIYHNGSSFDSTTFVSTYGTVGQGKYLFEVVYDSFGWGAKEKGMYIDSTGDIYNFTGGLSKLDTPFTGETLTGRYAPDRIKVGTVEPGILTSMANLIEPASKGELSDEIHQGYDLGIYRGVAYLFLPETGMYHGVFLFQEGDRIRSNELPEAKVLSDWLHELMRSFLPLAPCIVP